MSERSMNGQRGLGMMGLMAAAAVVIVVALLGMKVFPDVQEYLAALKTIKAVAADPASRSASVADIRNAYIKRAQIDNIQSVTASDLDISKEGGDVVISFSYTKRIPLYGPVSLAIDFEGSSSK